MAHLRCTVVALVLLSACGDDDHPAPAPDAAVSGASDAGVIAVADAAPSTHADAAATAATPPVTYWADMVPLFEAHCLTCHRADGIAPFRLDNYADAKQQAPLIATSTRTRAMPPWSVTSDGSCGEFQDSLALSDAEIARVAAWVDGGAVEGEQGTINLPAVPGLDGEQHYDLPVYKPEIAGGPLAESDDYHCFEVDPGVDVLRFITGTEVLPGNSAIVHHMVLSIVDPDAPAEAPAADGMSNAQRMAALDAETPDTVGWPCFALAGDGVSVDSVPLVWAPGQGVVRLPGDSGVPLPPKHKLVVQVHYNLADTTQIGKTDHSAFRLELAASVKNVGLFALVDPFLDSLDTAQPDTLPPGQASALYTWKRSAAELGIDSLQNVKLWGVMPHMHQRGHKYQLRVKPAGGTLSCAADVQEWDFHWQRMFFFAQPAPIDARSEFEVTCDFDTSDASEPVYPGWGTRNEMCLATLYLTVPAADAGL